VDARQQGGSGKEACPFASSWSVGVSPEKLWKTGANMCKLVHFVGEIRIYGVQDRGVHGNGKSHWNLISMGIT